MTKLIKLALFTSGFLASTLLVSLATSKPEGAVAAPPEEARPNIIFVLTDDQRYDELGVLNPILETPNMDRIAREGTLFANAFVTTALCSPSRASILTGQYMHNHGVVDNNSAPPQSSRFFPEFLQESGYNTAFIGKWHMGESQSSRRRLDDPQPGFDHWVSFAGQGEYYPVVRNGRTNEINVNGKPVPQKGYITDELTDYALDWLDKRDSDEPFFLYLSHKAVHANFAPAERHRDQYADKTIPVPESQADTPENRAGKPMWVQNQRNSWHGVDFPYHSSLDVQSYKMQYHRALSAVDDSLGRLFEWLEDNGQLENTVVVLMGDNGFMFGEHGLIDKRNAYEESMRVPLLMTGPSIAKNTVSDELVANIDIAPTLMAMAGVAPVEQFDGASFAGIARGDDVDWRDELLYEYYWEFNYPSTPTTFALRTKDYKFIQYHGLWDTDELYDMRSDPREMRNLINDPEYLAIVGDFRQRLYAELENNRGEHVVPYTRKFSTGAVYRHGDRSKAAEFPEKWERSGDEEDLRNFMVPDDVRAKREQRQRK